MQCSLCADEAEGSWTKPAGPADATVDPCGCAFHDRCIFTWFHPLWHEFPNHCPKCGVSPASIRVPRVEWLASYLYSECDKVFQERVAAMWRDRTPEWTRPSVRVDVAAFEADADEYQERTLTALREMGRRCAHWPRESRVSKEVIGDKEIVISMVYLTPRDAIVGRVAAVDAGRVRVDLTP